MTTCEIIQPQLTALLDRELTPNAAAKANLHLAGCPACAHLYAELAAAIKLSAAWAVDAPDIRDRVLQAAASDDQSLLLREMRLLRAELEELRAEVNVLSRQLARRSETMPWTPPTRPEYAKDQPRMENDPWNLIRS